MHSASSIVEGKPHIHKTQLARKVAQSKYPRSLPEQCIYDVPEKIRELKVKAFKPREISIGPTHKPHRSMRTLKRMEETKMGYCNAFLFRIEKCSRVSVSMDYFSSRVKEWEIEIQDSYEQPINNRHCLVETIAVDACFIVELFLSYHDHSRGIIRPGKDPLIGTRKGNDIFHDLILLENQVPFFVLERVYLSAGLGMNVSFLELTCSYFKEMNVQCIKPTKSPLHLTHLMREFMLPQIPVGRPNLPRQRNIVKHVYTISQLWKAGLEFGPSASTCPLNVEFRSGKLLLSPIELNDDTETLLRNILVLEQCHFRSFPLVAEYFFFLHLLVQSEKDTQILIENGIIVNWAGKLSHVPELFENLSKHIYLKNMDTKYHIISGNLNAFHDNWWNRSKALLWHVCREAPWKIMSFMAAVNILGLSWAQTIYSAKSYYGICRG